MPRLSKHGSGRGVIVAHPGRQHSHQLALALEAAGTLSGYWTGIPTRRFGERWVPERIWNRLITYGPVDLPPSCVRHFPVFPILAQVAGRTARPAREIQAWHIGLRAFDRWVASHLSRQTGVHGIIAYENSALHTFREARRRGIVTILDAASVHHTEQDRLDGYAELPALHRRITANKDAEVALADYVLCVSEVACESYLKAGVPAGKLSVVTLGADIEMFKPPGSRETRGKHVFGFVGGFSRHKGGDVLVDAFARVQQEMPCAQLVVIGRVASEFTASLQQSSVTLTGQLTQEDVAYALQGVDTLILPSRFDSFGMAVVEAMACGVPVIVSDRVGAKDIVEEGVNGWIVPVNDADALMKAMIQSVVALRERPEMRQEARRTAEQNTWDQYRASVVKQIAQWTQVQLI